MGLDITYGNQYFRAGSYSGFNAFRVWLMQRANGQNLDKMEGFCPALGKKWTGKEKFYALLNHSDCDGHLTHTQCKKMLEDIKTFDPGYGCVNNEDFYIERYAHWVKAIKWCAKEPGRRINFG